VRRAARQGLQPQGAAAAERVKGDGAGGQAVLLQYVENRLPHLVGGRADLIAGRHGQDAALVDAGGDSHDLK
jgi:hypothetical protein